MVKISNTIYGGKLNTFMKEHPYPIEDINEQTLIILMYDNEYEYMMIKNGDLLPVKFTKDRGIVFKDIGETFAEALSKCPVLESVNDWRIDYPIMRKDVEKPMNKIRKLFKRNK